MLTKLYNNLTGISLNTVYDLKILCATYWRAAVYLRIEESKAT